MSLQAKIEAVIYASEEPVTLAQLTELLSQEAQQELDRQRALQGELPLATVPVEPDTLEIPQDADTPLDVPATGEGKGLSLEEKRQQRERDRQLREFFRSLLAELIREYATSDRGIEIREVAGGYRMGTKPEYHDAVRGFVRSLKPPLKLTLQALETLAVVAYKQPVTAPEVGEIRGVDSGGVLASLMTRKLITTAGRKQVVGRPILYKTTKDFLLRFGLKDIAELPSIEEFEKMAGELAAQEEMDMPEAKTQGQQLEQQEGHSGSEPEDRLAAESAEEVASTSAVSGENRADDLQPGESNQPSESNLPGGETPAVDGRISGPPPTYERAGDNPSAEEAAIQSGRSGGQ